MRSPTRYTKQLWRGQNRLDYWNDAPDRTYTLRRTLRALGITKDESRVSECARGSAWHVRMCSACRCRVIIERGSPLAEGQCRRRAIGLPLSTKHLFVDEMGLVCIFSKECVIASKRLFCPSRRVDPPI